jgi:tellurite resistance protein TerC
MMDKFYYLKPGLALILFFIGIKMVISDFYKIPITISLVIIFAVLAAAMVLSFVKTYNKANVGSPKGNILKRK